MHPPALLPLTTDDAFNGVICKIIANGITVTIRSTESSNFKLNLLARDIEGHEVIGIYHIKQTDTRDTVIQNIINLIVKAFLDIALQQRTYQELENRHVRH